MKHKNILLKWALSILFLCSNNILQAQVVIETGCPPNGTEKTQFSMEFFLYSPYFEDERSQSGTSGILINEIGSIDSQTICNQLNEIIQGNEEYKRIDQDIPIDETKYFYQTNDFYFIFWDLKAQTPPPGGGTRTRLGPKKLFIVISKDFQTIWEFYV